MTQYDRLVLIDKFVDEREFVSFASEHIREIDTFPAFNGILGRLLRPAAGATYTIPDLLSVRPIRDLAYCAVRYGPLAKHVRTVDQMILDSDLTQFDISWLASFITRNIDALCSWDGMSINDALDMNTKRIISLMGLSNSDHDHLVSRAFGSTLNELRTQGAIDVSKTCAFFETEGFTCRARCENVYLLERVKKALCLIANEITSIPPAHALNIAFDFTQYYNEHKRAAASHPPYRSYLLKDTSTTLSAPMEPSLFFEVITPLMCVPPLLNPAFVQSLSVDNDENALDLVLVDEPAHMDESLFYEVVVPHSHQCPSIDPLD